MKELTELEERDYESNIVDALLEAADYYNRTDNTQPIVIKRGDKVMFEFTVAPINEDIWRKCRKQNNKGRGRGGEDIDNSRMFAQAIYEATIDEDKQRLWRNKEIQKRLNVGSGVDVVNLVLTAGEKLAIINVLEKMAGNDVDMDDLLKKE